MSEIQVKKRPNRSRIKLHTISIRLTDAQLLRLNELCELFSLSYAEVIRDMIDKEHYLNYPEKYKAIFL